MFITLSFKKSLIVEQFQGNYLKLAKCPVVGTKKKGFAPPLVSLLFSTSAEFY